MLNILLFLNEYPLVSAGIVVGAVIGTDLVTRAWLSYREIRGTRHGPHR